jgi:aminopeptidase N
MSAKTTVFEPTPLMSMYLLTLIVGKFERYVLPKEKQAKCCVEVAGYAPHGNREHWWG